MPTDSLAHFVFVDLENVSDLDLTPLAAYPVNVTLLVGKKQTDLPKKLVEQITRLPFEVRLVKVGVTRKNALDFSLVFHLGQMAGRHPDANFYIVSKDKRDFDMITDHMRAHQVRVARIDSLLGLPFLPPTVPTAAVLPKPPAPVIKKPVVVDKRVKVIARLKNPAILGRPGAEKALRAHIKTALGKGSSPAMVTEIVNQLCAEGVLAMEPAGKIVWR